MANNPFTKLNLPSAGLNFQSGVDGTVKVFDFIRKKYVTLTPEEWVRQNFTAFLVNSLGYPAGLMANEVKIVLNGTTRRCDTIVYDRNASPVMIVEYKAPSVAISQETFNQIVRYNMVLKVRFLVVTNGLTHYCCKIDYNPPSYAFLTDVPSYETLLNY